MTRHPWAAAGLALCLLSLGHHAAAADPPTRDEALAALRQAEPAARRAAAQRLGEVGTMADAERLAAALKDGDADVRAQASASLWRIWSRSGDPEIDALLAQGSAQIQAWDFADALTTFNEIVRRRPDFAEGWNKRATVLFLMGEHEASLEDCDEVLRRNPLHFGALSGAGQNHAELGRIEQAIAFYQRALVIHPHLPGPAASILVLQRVLKARERGRV